MKKRLKKKTVNQPFTGVLRPAPTQGGIMCRVIGLIVFALGVLMLFRYSMACVNTEPLGLYNNQIEPLLEKGTRIVAVIFGSSALSFLLPGLFTAVTGAMVFIGRRSRLLFGVSIALTLICGSIGRLVDSIFHVLSPGQIRYTTWLLFGGMTILIVGTILAGREHAKMESKK